ncbi:cell wall hydrolase [Alteribacter lacisalsi]|uniref:Cell wall hydrolase n=1 Tax=Alteribacter lacisalsi TaxID=2045244 RepID=A0A2W0HE50_9BACI|nr:cell wall hydrolase [Alteribacter lacisalsi]
MIFFIFTFAVLFLPADTKASVLQEGSSGEQVTELQETLFHLGYLPVSPTGYYGALTEEAVRSFQADFSLQTDGAAGPITLQKADNVSVMARVVYGEARGESYEGQVAVAAVILNRIKDPGFPSDVRGVVFQRNAFTAVHDGQYYLTPNQTAYKAVRDAHLGSDPSQGSTYYYNPDIATSQWIFSRSTVTRIGKHLFAE